jgi:hypothetical protein
MSTHLAVGAPPVMAVRAPAPGVTGFQGRRSRRRSDFRSDIKSLLSHSGGRHRLTFIPLDSYSARMD